ncbi:hypothetical protein CS022_18505 [Veronia nyctiphanis]|uniref:AB hydrolase-1 domain-containing protein n=1 Tax=Veronia nyctiphanis TaxID=1278244 RepID=A0A4Q0YSQ6_9GAMM|nr:alpha/beta fold hydrolase [Veronia nyctiphanis]RXJ71991.1 hypothetical protein CS022_18505 [Veronia nyctiphanis]
MLKHAMQFVFIILIMTLGGCTQVCVEQGIKPIFLPNFLFGGIISEPYDKRWSEEGGLKYFIDKAESWDSDALGFPAGSENHYKVFDDNGHQQLLHYITVPQETLLHPSPKGTVIYLAGWGGYWSDLTFDDIGYRDLIDNLRQDGYALLLVDLRGHGLSEASIPYKAASTYGDRDVSDLTLLLNDIGDELARPLLTVGHSYGASAGTLLAIKNPDVVASVNLAGLSTIDNVMQSVRGAAMQINQSPDLNLVSDSTLALLDFCEAQTGFLDALLSKAESDYNFDRNGSDITKLSSDALDVPMLLVGATKDTNVPIENLYQIKDSRSGSDVVRVIVYEDCNHVSFLNKGTLLTQVSLFLNAVVSGNTPP